MCVLGSDDDFDDSLDQDLEPIEIEQGNNIKNVNKCDMYNEIMHVERDEDFLPESSPEPSSQPSETEESPALTDTQSREGERVRGREVGSRGGGRGSQKSGKN